MSNRPIVTTQVVVFSLKTFLSAMLAYFVAISFDLPRPFWAVATVYIVANPLSGAIASKSAYRLLGTIIGAAAAVVLIPNLVNEPILLSAAIIVWVSTCTFVSLLDRTPRSYVCLLAGYTVLLAGLPLVTAPSNTFDTVVSRVEEIGLAIICASLVSHIVLPVHVGTVILRRIDGWMARAGTLFASAASGPLDDVRGRNERHGLAADATDLRSMTMHLQYDGSRHRSAVSLVRRLQRRMLSLLPLEAEFEDLRQSLLRLGTPRSEGVFVLMANVGSAVGPSSMNDAGDMKAKIDALGPLKTLPSWEDLLIANAARNLRDILCVRDDCIALRASIEGGRSARAAPRSAAVDRTPAAHRDFGMALLSALAVAVCLSSSTFFWIAAGWSDGMTFAQVSGVLCCLLATMDDPVPAMRKFVGVTFVTVVVAFVYAFAVLPMIDDFVPLVAALALFFVPAGICLAIPSLALVGMGLCINFPLLLTLQAQQGSDFAAFANGGVATIFAMIWTIVVCGLFRSVGAETNARRLISVTRKQVATIAADKHSDADAMRHRLIDIAGLFAPRAAKLSPGSEMVDADLIRNLRIGLHLAAMRDLIDGASEPVRLKSAAIFEALQGFSDPAADGRRASSMAAIVFLDDLIGFPQGNALSRAEHELLVSAAALRLCLAPDADPPVSSMLLPTGRTAA
ncbi:FUSC family protein [Rhizobium sp. P38BS-XIX]|uniref:FUSC family protein n=1 Tax=Rhizobium sp. P38BS-XIX TaxID=2726740 RepID=UPI0014579498|nr:FUSC family protein [Rhizobium sp. P38BS-XIX]NLS00833.1 FUSC family protein [Rhizobium sp. P38BS-XIX]